MEVYDYRHLYFWKRVTREQILQTICWPHLLCFIHVPGLVLLCNNILEIVGTLKNRKNIEFCYVNLSMLKNQNITYLQIFKHGHHRCRTSLGHSVVKQNVLDIHSQNVAVKVVIMKLQNRDIFHVQRSNEVMDVHAKEN